MAKVIFLHLSVILFTGGGSASVHAGIPPQIKLHPARTRQTPPRPDPPRPGRPPWTRHHHPPTRQTAPPRSRLQHTVYEQPVRILLECILVLQMLILSHYNATVNQYKHLVNFIFFGLDLLPTLVEKGVIL